MFDERRRQMKKNLSEIVFVIDRSGSMHGLEKDTIGGFNSMLDRQRKEKGEALVTTIFFSDSSVVVHDRIPIEEVADITDKDYEVGGCTALLDAVGDAICHVERIHRYARKEDVPEHTLFVITTDGMENASRNRMLPEVRNMIEKKRKQGWQFIFLGANIDAVGTAVSMGMPADMAVEYEATGAGTELNYRAMCSAISALRNDRKIDLSWKEEIEKASGRRRK